jgi:hypothetical protein
VTFPCRREITLIRRGFTGFFVAPVSDVGVAAGVGIVAGLLDAIEGIGTLSTESGL